MRVYISGASGFIGTPLSSYFKTRGHEVVSTPEDLLDVVIHLAGEPIFGRWTSEKKKKIFESRKFGTQQLSHLLSHLKHPPKLFISASAIGFYGNRGEELLTEGSPKGKGFLSDVCQAWEEASFALERRGTRIVHARFGMVLGSQGGALKKMLPLYRLGLGARLGEGHQWVSWITLIDLIRAIDHIIHTPEVQGTINLVSPHPVRQFQFAKMLAHILHRPFFLQLPRWILQLLFGEMANDLILSSAKVEPSKLLASNFSFDYPDLQSALSNGIWK